MDTRSDSGQESPPGGASLDPTSRSALDSGSVHSSGMAGDGARGGLTGAIGTCCTVAAIMPTGAMRSMTATPTLAEIIVGIHRMGVEIAVCGATVEEMTETAALAPLVGSAMAEMRGDFLRVACPVWVEAVVVAASMVVGAGDDGWEGSRPANRKRQTGQIRVPEDGEDNDLARRA